MPTKRTAQKRMGKKNQRKATRERKQNNVNAERQTLGQLSRRTMEGAAGRGG